MTINVSGYLTRSDWTAVGDLILYESMRLDPQWRAVFDARGLQVPNDETVEAMRDVHQLLLMAGAGRIASIADDNDVAGRIADAEFQAGVTPFTETYDSQSWQHELELETAAAGWQAA
jgi:hypothetical protein